MFLFRRLRFGLLAIQLTGFRFKSVFAYLLALFIFNSLNLFTLFSTIRLIIIILSLVIKFSIIFFLVHPFEPFLQFFLAIDIDKVLTINNLFRWPKWKRNLQMVVVSWRRAWNWWNYPRNMWGLTKDIIGRGNNIMFWRVWLVELESGMWGLGIVSV